MALSRDASTPAKESASLGTPGLKRRFPRLKPGLPQKTDTPFLKLL
jgi:hypothetical protein